MRNSHQGSCHCGKVEFVVHIDGDLPSPSRCDCSYCKRRQVAAVGIPISDLEVVKGEENLTLYQWGTMTAKHYFCRTCGIYTHHQRRSNPNQYGFNVACLEGINPYELEVEVTDGVNHPSDG